MDDKKYYDEFLNDTAAVDRVTVHLESMIKNAPNARIRTQAERALADLNLVLAICQELKKHYG